VFFLLKYHQKTPSPQETEHKKEERKIIKKRKEKKRKKKKAPTVSSNRGEVNILRGKNTSTSKTSFLM
jgi:hypothetical protein